MIALVRLFHLVVNYSTRVFTRFISTPARHEPVVTSVERNQMRSRQRRESPRVLHLAINVTVGHWETPRRSPGTKSFICRMTQRPSAALVGRLFFSEIFKGKYRGRSPGSNPRLESRRFNDAEFLDRTLSSLENARARAIGIEESARSSSTPSTRRHGTARAEGLQLLPGLSITAHGLSSPVAPRLGTIIPD